MSKLALPDSRGGRSITLTFVAISWLVVTILGIWLGRKATEQLRG